MNNLNVELIVGFRRGVLGLLLLLFHLSIILVLPWWFSIITFFLAIGRSEYEIV